MVFLAKCAQVFALLALLVGVEARLLEFVVRNRVLHAVHDELDALLNVGQLFGQGGLAQLNPCASLVDQVDGLIRKEAIGNVAAGSGYRGLRSPRRCS